MSTKQASQQYSEVRAILNGIHDPCSISAGEPIGLVDMGIIEAIHVEEASVRIRLMPTYPGCLFLGIFEVEAKDRLRALPWCTDVCIEMVSAGEAIWGEERMAPTARARLVTRRQRIRERSGQHPETHARKAGAG